MPNTRQTNAVRLEYARGSLVQTKLLTRLLADDPHFGPYMAIRGKGNGFDIEGLAVTGRRLLPGLRGWSALLEIEVEAHAGHLHLVLYDAPGPDRRDGDLTVFGELLHRK